MVFGAMTQANGFETGWNINNLRWTGDYWISQENFIIDIDINPDGSNIFYFSSFSVNSLTNSNACVLSLGKNYILSSNIGLPIRTPSTNLNPNPLGGIGGWGFDSTGNKLYFSNDGRVSNTWLTDSFIIPPSFSPNSNTLISSSLSAQGFLTDSNSTYLNVAQLPTGSGATNKNITPVNKTNGTFGGFIAPASLGSIYNIGGHHGISVKRDGTVMLSLDGLNITSNLWLLNRINLLNSTSLVRNKYDFVNIYSLFPANMKPTRGCGIVVDRENGQWLFVAALINNKYTICKFQLRAT